MKVNKFRFLIKNVTKIIKMKMKYEIWNKKKLKNKCK